jgi:hypothetical protein
MQKKQKINYKKINVVCVRVCVLMVYCCLFVCLLVHALVVGRKQGRVRSVREMRSECNSRSRERRKGQTERCAIHVADDRFFSINMSICVLCFCCLHFFSVPYLILSSTRFSLSQTQTLSFPPLYRGSRSLRCCSCCISVLGIIFFLLSLSRVPFTCSTNPDKENLSVWIDWTEQ